MRNAERLAYVNGAFVPESEAKISIHDLGFVYGDAVYDTARTFAGRLFKLREHVERLYDSLRYVQIDPGLAPAEMARLTEELVARNLPLLRPGEDFWVTQRVSRGLSRYEGDPVAYEGATVVIECVPLPLRGRAHYFRDGIPVATPSVRRIAPDALSPRAKTTNYLNMTLGDLEVKARDPKLWAVLLDHRGKLSEGIGANIFLVRHGRVLTPGVEQVLPGISRATVLELCRAEGIPAEERDLDLHDAYLAEEAFLTSTSLCLCPVASINGRTFPGGVPGMLSRRLMTAYSRLVGLDYVQQYLERLPR